MLKLEVDGREPSAEDLWDAALDTYGHFTALQVRGGRTRGLALHLKRLDMANRELFGDGLDPDHLKHLMRHALEGVPGATNAGADASLRVIVRKPPSGQAPARIFVSVRPPYELPDAPQSLKSVPYVREVPHVKRPGDFAHAYYIDRALAAGYDDALFVSPDGAVAEAGIANIAFFDGQGAVWPDGPALPGVTMQLVAPLLAGFGMPSRCAPVHLDDTKRMSGACVTNSRGIAPVNRIDDVTLPVMPAFLKAMREAYASVPWDEI